MIDELEMFLTMPLPPSENRIRQIRCARRGGKVIRHIGWTDEAKKWKSEFVAQIREHYLSEVMRFSSGHTLLSTYSVTVDLGIPEKQLLNKGWLKKKAKSPYKKNDGPNRTKLMLDSLADATQIDDSLYFHYGVRKTLSPKETLTIQISRVRRPDLEFGIPKKYLEVGLDA